MKTLFTIFVLLIATIAHANIFDDITEAIKTGDTEKLSEFFNENIEIKILEEENVYSKSQANLILKSFFKENTPQKFTISHKGGQESAKFAIGNLETSNGNFRLQFFLKKNGDKLYIQKFTVERA